jgi:hypothetical protein
LVSTAISTLNSLKDSVYKIQDLDGIKKYSENKPNVVLFSNKKETPLLLKSLSIENQDNFNFCFVTEEELSKEFNIEERPKILLIKKKKEDTNIFDRKIVYNGPLSKADLQKFLNQNVEKVEKTPIKQENKVEEKVIEKVDELNQKNFDKFCDRLCLIGCVRNKDDENLLNSLNLKYYKDDKIKFTYVDINKDSDFCSNFIQEKSLTFNLIMLRKSKLKYSTLIDGNEERIEKLIENTLYGLQKFQFIDSIPNLNKKDEL